MKRELKLFLFKIGLAAISALSVKIVLCMLLIITSSCHENQATKRDSVFVANLDDAYTSEFKYSDLYSRVTAITLENKDIILNEISKMLVYKDRLYLLDRKVQGLYVFQKDGSFVRKFGNLGSGLGEYASCKDFAINTDAGEIYIYDMVKKRIHAYDIVSGTYRKSIQLDESIGMDYIAYCDGYLYAAQTSNRNKEKEDTYYLLYQIDIRSGKKTAQWLDTASYSKGWNDEFIHSHIFYNIKGNENLFVLGLMDTIMCIKKNEVLPYLAIESKRLLQKDDILEEEKMPTSNPRLCTKHMMSLLARTSAQNKVHRIFNVFEHNSMLYFNFMDRTNHFVKYDERRGTTSIYSQTMDDVLFQVIPSHFQIPVFLSADVTGVYYCVSNDNLDELKSFVEENYVSEGVVNKESIRNLDDDSNPVLLYYEYK